MVAGETPQIHFGGEKVPGRLRYNELTAGKSSPLERGSHVDICLGNAALSQSLAAYP
jgi:hypothetical protein